MVTRRTGNGASLPFGTGLEITACARERRFHSGANIAHAFPEHEDESEEVSTNR
jgi:hypothetical protein